MSLELILAVSIGTLAGCGIYLLLRARTFPVIVGLTLLSYAVNLFLFAMSRPVSGVPPIAGRAGVLVDPLPQALVLTAIVIGFAMTAYAIVLAMRARGELGNDHVDGHGEPSGNPAP